MINTVNFQPSRTRTRPQRTSNTTSQMRSIPQRTRTRKIRRSHQSSDSSDDNYENITVIQTVPDHPVLLSDDNDSSSESSSDHVEVIENQSNWAAPLTAQKPDEKKSSASSPPESPQEQKNVKKRRIRKRKVASTTGEEEDTKTEPETPEKPKRKKVKRIRKRVVNDEPEPSTEPEKKPEPAPPKKPSNVKIVKEIKESKESSTEEIKVTRKRSAAKKETEPELTPEQLEEIAKLPLDVKDSSNFEIKRHKSLLGAPAFTLIQSDRSLYFTKYGKLSVGKGFSIFKKNFTDGEFVGFLRQHDRKRRFTFYVGKDEESLGEVFGLCYINNKETSERIRQIRVCFPKSRKLNYPATKDQNLSRICMKYGQEHDEPEKSKDKDKEKEKAEASDSEDTQKHGEEEEKTIINFDDYDFFQTMVPCINDDGSLTLNFAGATPEPSMKNFIIRKPKSNKVSVMVFRVSKEMFKVRYDEPWTLESSFGFALAALFGDG